jgi:hypothetical protein
LQSYKIFQGIAIPYSALVSIIFGLMIFSFPLGGYLFFNSQIGKNIDYHYPLSEIGFIQHYDLQPLAAIEIGDVFVVLWVFFLILFTIAVLGPKKNFLKVLSPIMAGTYESQDGNYLVHAIKWFSIIIILSEIIDITQQFFDIKTVPPTFENDLLQLLSVTFAPVIEEIGFRIILIGIPLFLLYSHKASAKHFFKSLWNPSASLPSSSSKKAIVIIVIAGVFFGISHIISEQWGVGKLAQATMSGIILGWVYYRYGFVASVLIHWATNYMIFSYGYLVSSVNETRIYDAFSHSLLQTIEILFVVTGALSIALLSLQYRKKKLEI